MAKKNGFIAVSLIYSFFLVFLMIMLSSSMKNAEIRLMLQTIKDDIKMNLNGEAEFVVTTIPEKNPENGNDYEIGDEINFVGESWLVVENKADSVVIVLKRALNMEEVTTSLEVDAYNNDYFAGACDDTSCKVRMCMNTYYSNFCFYESATNYEYYNWENSIAKKVVDTWFENNVNLQKACRLQYDPIVGKRICTKDTIINMTFQDGIQENEGYIRLATFEEASAGTLNWVPNNGGYLAPEAWSVTSQSNESGISKIYDITGTTKQNADVMTIRPVIEVRKN